MKNLTLQNLNIQKLKHKKEMKKLNNMQDRYSSNFLIYKKTCEKLERMRRKLNKDIANYNFDNGFSSISGVIINI